MADFDHDKVEKRSGTTVTITEITSPGDQLYDPSQESVWTKIGRAHV